MRILLDTQVAIWALTGDSRLSKEAAKSIVSADAVYLSAASVWEVAIKHGIGKIDVTPGAFLEGALESGFALLPITAGHAALVSGLPPIHSDPFDRLLIAQASSEPLHLLTADAQLRAYSDLIILN